MILTKCKEGLAMPATSTCHTWGQLLGPLKNPGSSNITYTHCGYCNAHTYHKLWYSKVLDFFLPRFKDFSYTLPTTCFNYVCFFVIDVKTYYIFENVRCVLQRTSRGYFKSVFTILDSPPLKRTYVLKLCLINFKYEFRSRRRGPNFACR